MAETDNSVSKLSSTTFVDDENNVVEDPSTAKFHTVYFYYYDYRNPSMPRTRAYYSFILAQPIEDLPNKLAALVRNARKDLDNPPSHGTSPADLKRRRKGYIAVMVDAANFKLAKPYPFILDNGNGKHAGHTFTEPKSMDITLDRGEVVRVGYCINWMQDIDTYENLEDNNFEEFTLRMNFDPAPPTTLRVRSDDSGGTNMGGTVAPPAR